MPYYDLLIVNDNRMLATAASNREEAIAIFGKELDRNFTFAEQGTPAPYMLDEWHEGPHWVKPTISVFEVPKWSKNILCHISNNATVDSSISSYDCSSLTFPKAF